MSTPLWSLRRLKTVDDAQIDGLADVLIDCVEGGASVSFMHPLTRGRAVEFWRRVAGCAGRRYTTATLAVSRINTHARLRAYGAAVHSRRSF